MREVKSTDDKTYKMIKLIKSGDYSDVFIVENKKDKDVKLIGKQAKLIPEDSLKLLKKEYNYLLDINNKKCPHIVQVEGFVSGIDDYNREYGIILEEYAKGDTLLEFINNLINLDQKISVETLYNYLNQLIEAIECFHSNHICNMDIKLDNIMFRDTDHKELVIIDFGLSKKYEQKYKEDCTDIYNLAIVFKTLGKITNFGYRDEHNFMLLIEEMFDNPDFDINKLKLNLN